MNDVTVIPGNTAVAEWDPNSGAPLPAYLTMAQDELGSNISDRVTVPTLSYEGKTWQIKKGGETTRLQVANADGDMVPVPIMRMVVLNFNPDRGRAYYPGLYNPAAAAAPKCWSADGKTPDASVREKESPTCQGCPQSIKGSKVQDGKEMVACSSYRMLAILPAMDLTHEPLRLKLAVTSDYDKEIVEHGWFAFRQYSDWLKSRGIGHTGLVVTKAKFDMSSQFPKVLFALDRVLSQAEIAQVKVALQDPRVGELLSEKWSAAGANGVQTNDADLAPQPDLQQTDPQLPTPSASVTSRDKALADGWVQHPDSPPHGYKGDQVLAWDVIEAAYPLETPPAPQPVATPPPPPAPAPESAPAHDPIAAAKADGWVQHPESTPHGYKGQEVLTWEDIAARYPGNATPTPAASAPAAPATETPAAATTAGAGGDALPPDVQNLLTKWS